jgi:autotransporter-associated beta strand protein
MKGYLSPINGKFTPPYQQETNMKPTKLLRSFLLAAGSSLLAISSASAQTALLANGTNGNPGTTANFTSINASNSINYSITGNSNQNNFAGVIRNFSGNNTLSGNILLNSPAGNIRIDANEGNLILAGNITQTVTNRNLILAPYSGTITVNNPIAINGGALVVIGAGTTILNAQSGTGIIDTRITQNGHVQLGVTDALNTTQNLGVGSGTADPGTFTLNGFNQTVNILAGSSGSATRIVRNNHATNASTLTVGNGGGTGEFNGTIINGAAATLALVKTGAGNQTLSGINTYSGNTTISGGSLALSGSGSIASSPVIQINSSTSLNVTGVTGSFTIGSSQTVGGTGSIVATGKTIVADGTLSPGNSPGAMIVDGGVLQLGVGGDTNMQVFDANGAAGVGYDTVNLINGATLDLSALGAGNTYNINLWSLSGIGPDVNGNATNFNNTLNYSWTLFDTGTAISGFSTDKFTLNLGAFNGTDGFTNALGGGSFSVGLADSDTNLVVNFTAIPEPSAALLGAIGLLALLRRRRSA